MTASTALPEASSQWQRDLHREALAFWVQLSQRRRDDLMQWSFTPKMAAEGVTWNELTEIVRGNADRRHAKMIYTFVMHDGDFIDRIEYLE